MASVISPQPLAVGETTQKAQESVPPHNPKLSYASQLVQKDSAAKSPKMEFCPITFVKGQPSVEFTVEEVNAFTVEEGLHQAVILKFSYGKPDIQELRHLIPKQFDVKGNCNVGQLEFRHILVRLDLFDDFVQVLSKATGYVKEKGEEYFFRSFPWTMGFNPREETPKAVVWISMPDLPANLFAKKSLLSIAAAVGKPLAVDKATQDRTRPSTARVKVLLDLTGKLPNKIRINIVDVNSGKSVEYHQVIVYDNLPKYCTICMHQGHEEKMCRWRTEEKNEVAVQEEASEHLDSSVKLAGNARDPLIAKQAEPAAVNPKAKKLSGEAGENSVSGTSVPVTAAVARVLQNLITEKNNRGSGEFINASIECNSSRFKDKAAVADLDVMQNSEKQQGTIVPQLEVNTALTTGGIPKAGFVTSTVAQDVHDEDQKLDIDASNISAVASVEPGVGRKAVDAMELAGDNAAGLNNTVPLDAGASQLQTKTGSKVVTTSYKSFTKNRKWAVVKNSPTRKHPAGVQNQMDPSNVIGVSNPFEALGNESEQEEDNNKEQHKDGLEKIPSVAGSINQQKSAKHIDALQVQNIEDADTLGSAGADTQTLHISKLELDKMITNALAAMMKNTGARSRGGKEKNESDSADDDVDILGNAEASVSAIATGVIECGQTTPTAATPTIQFSNLQLNSAEQQIRKEVDQPTSTRSKSAGKLAGMISESDTKRFGEKQNKSVSASGGGKQKNASVDAAKAAIARDFIAKNTDVNAAALRTAVQRDDMHQGEYVADSQQLAIVPVDEQMTGAVNHTDSKEVELMASSSNVPTLYYSSPQVENIIKEAQAAMVTNTTMVKQPLVTMNTSVYEVPSQSMGSYGGEAGQLLLSTGNNNVGNKEWDPDDVVSTHEGADQQSEGEISIGSPSVTGKELTVNPNNPNASAYTSGATNLRRAANFRELVSNSKLWDQQREEDDEEDYGNGFAGYESEEEEQQVDYESAGEDIDAPRIAANTTRLLNFYSSTAAAEVPKSILNHNAPVFVPRTNPSVDIQNAEIAKKFQTEFTMQQQLGSGGISGKQQAGPSTTSASFLGTEARHEQQQQSNAIIPAVTSVDEQTEEKEAIERQAGRLAITVESKQTTPMIQTMGQQHTTNTAISLEERKLLDAMDGNTLVPNGFEQNAPQPVQLGREIFEQGEEEAMMQQCRAEAARKGDLSPTHSGKSKKSRTRDRSCDGRQNNQDLAIRIPPMRNAKQKAIVPTTSARSNKSKKK